MLLHHLKNTFIELFNQEFFGITDSSINVLKYGQYLVPYKYTISKKQYMLLKKIPTYNKDK